MIWFYITVSLWFISEILYWIDTFKNWEFTPIRTICDVVGSVSKITLFYFLYSFVVDMATGQYQLYQMLLELAAVLKQ